jgi:DNA repair protein RecO (recombination protein O)
VHPAGTVSDPRMPSELRAAFLLHRRPYRETSLLLEAFSLLHGRVGLVARGARPPRARWRVTFEPFRPLVLAWKGRGDLGTLIAAEPDGPPIELHGRAVASGFYLNELLMRLLQRHDPHPQLYAQYARALSALGAGCELETVLRRFEKQLLEALGYGLQLERDADRGWPIIAETRYVYAAQAGPLGAPTASTQGIAVHGKTLLAIAGEEFDAQSSREAKRLMRYLLQQHLGERPLASRELLRSTRR